jgi:hypothetical protein
MAYTSPNIVTSGTTFIQLQAGGLSSVLEAVLTANKNASAAPTAPATATAAGGGSSGGLLAAGTYFFVFTETDGTGETTPSPQGAQLTVATGDEPQFTFPTLQAGNTARNLYLGAVNGATGGPYTLYATGIAATTFNATVAAPTNSFAVNPPTFNSTAFSYVDATGATQDAVISNIRSLKNGNFPNTYKNAAQVIDSLLHGDPVPFNGVETKLHHFHTAVAVLNQACIDIGTLIDANAGTIKPTQDGAGNGTRTRTWP